MKKSMGKNMEKSMEKILVIDDNRLHAQQLKTILEKEYEITVAQTAEEGLQYISQENFSLILLDIVMPGMDGFTLLKKLQEEVITKSIPVIMITGLSDVKSEHRGLMLGAVDYIVKPFQPIIVQARVNTHIKLFNYRRQVEYQSKIDQLTGVPNRRQHDEYSIVKWKEAVRLQVPFSICMLDIDRFKMFNDTFGHPAGDKVITAVAQTASRHLQRTTDFFCRYGGEEFVAFMMGDSSEMAFEYMKKIRQEIEDLNIVHPDPAQKWVTVSIGGITMIPEAGDSYEHYLKLADFMMYDAKKFGRNMVVWADEDRKQLREK